MISTLLAVGITLIVVAILIGLVYVGFYALIYIIPIVLLLLFAYVIYCVVKQTFFK